MHQTTKQLEALLFVAGEAVMKKELIKLLGATEEDFGLAATELREALKMRGLTLVETDTHLLLTTDASVADFLAQFNQQEATPLSKAAMETLAIIAYRGPVSRYDVDILRGVDSRAMIRQLTKRGLLRRVSSAGETPMYNVTEEFFQSLGITSKERLPAFEELSNNEQMQQLLNS